jgi:hypothetical protein
MAKASIGHPAQAKVKAAAPAAAARKKAKMTAEPKRKAGGAGSAAPKPTPAPRKKVAVLGSSKTVAAKGKTATLKQDAAAKKAAPSKPAAAAKKTAAVKKPVAKTAAARTGAAAKASRTKSVAKPAAVKNTAPRRRAARTAVPVPAPRRGRPPATASRTTPAAASRTTPTSPPGGRPGDSAPQVFTVSHLNEADFKADGLRAYAQYRDLGIAAATGGLCQAHVIRLVPPCTDDVRKRHQHEADLQLVYVLQGWMKNEFEGHGVQMMSAGSCWLQPSGIKHTVLDYSADCEVLEIIVPADFKTEDAA